MEDEYDEGFNLGYDMMIEAEREAEEEERPTEGFILGYDMMIDAKYERVNIDENTIPPSLLKNKTIVRYIHSIYSNCIPGGIVRHDAVIINYVTFNINRRGYKSMFGNCATLLLKVIEEFNVEAVKLCLDIPTISVNMPCSGGTTPLIAAISVNKVEIVNLLLAHPKINVNKGTTYHGQTEVNSEWPSTYPLLDAVSKGNIDIIKTLLNAPGIDVNITNEYGVNAIAKALMNEEPNYPKKEILNILFSTKRINTRFTYLLRGDSDTHGDSIETRSYMDGTQVYYKFGPELIEAIEQQRVEDVQRLVSDPMLNINYIHSEDPRHNMGWGDGPNPQSGTFPLAKAIISENETIVRLLLSHPHIDVNNKLACYSSWQSWHEYTVIVPSARSALMYAVETGNIAITRRLLNVPGIDVNQQTVGRKISALMIAVQRKDIAMIELLLSVPTINLRLCDYKNHSIFDILADPDYDRIIDEPDKETIHTLLYMFVTHPNAARWGGHALLSSRFYKDPIWADFINPAFTQVVVQMNTHNKNKFNKARYSALYYAIHHMTRHIEALICRGINITRLLRLAIEGESKVLLRYVVQRLTRVQLERALTYKYACRNTFARLEYMDCIHNRIQELNEIRSLTEVELFATHIRPLPIDVQKIIGKMLKAS